MRNLLLLLLLSAASALAADFSGNWSGTGEAHGQSHSLYFVIRQTGSTLTGTGGPTASEQHAFQNGKVDGNKITFDVIPEGKGTLHFELTTDGDALKGTVEIKREEDSESGTVSLKRETSI